MRAPLAVLRCLLLSALVLAPVARAEAQKSTIQRRGSEPRGGSAISGPSISGGGTLRSSPPRGGVANPSGGRGGEGIGSVGRSGRPATLAPGFPQRGRGAGDAVSRRTSPTVKAFPSGTGATGRSSIGVQSRAGSAKANLRRVPRTSAGSGKRFIDLDDGRGHRDRRFVDDRRWRHVRRDDGVRILVYDPFFYDPFTRYRYFDRYRYYSGFGCGFYDRWFPGHYGFGHYRHDPCYSGFHLFLGWPWLVDPWPGFWSYGYYGDLHRGRRFDYRQGFREGYDRGYVSGRALDGGDGIGAEAYGDSYGDPGSGSFAEGRVRMAEGDYAGALDAFQRYVDENPDDPLGYLSTGLALTALGHYGKAADQFRGALDASPPGERPALDAPALFGSRREYRLVEEDLEAYVRRHADSRDARFDLGMLYLLSGERGAAGSLFQGLRSDPYARYLLEALPER